MYIRDFDGSRNLFIWEPHAIFSHLVLYRIQGSPLRLWGLPPNFGTYTKGRVCKKRAQVPYFIRCPETLLELLRTTVLTLDERA